MLYNQETRQRILNDLEELEFYLSQRLYELEQKDQALFDQFRSSTSKCENPDEIKSCLKSITDIKKLMNGVDTLKLIQIRTKP